jgi:hypothetical protein
MPAYVTREEFKVLQDEKLVTRHIFEQTRLNSKDLAVTFRRASRARDAFLAIHAAGFDKLLCPL